MRYHVLATDYDGTLAEDGRVHSSTVAALEKLAATGRKLVLVTGRELPELLGIFPEIHLFTRVVAENGALIYEPGSKETRLLCPPPPPAFVQAIHAQRTTPVSVGQAIVAGWKPQETLFLDLIRDLGLDLQVIFNKDAVMVLPAGVNKATGLKAALKELGLSLHETVGIGDAENDLAFLTVCECSAAVANSLPAVLGRTDLATLGARGAGVVQLIERLIDNDLVDLEPRLVRHQLLLGSDPQGQEVRLPSYGYNLLVAGPSGSGKSTAATAILERLLEQRYQFCILDPEGDYENLEGAVTLGNRQRAPNQDEILQVLTNSHDNVVVNLLGLALGDRPPFFLALLPRLLEMRAKTGRPHWLVVDEAHHLLPKSYEPGPTVLNQDLTRTVFITVHADLVAPAVLKTIDRVIAVGDKPEETISQFLQARGDAPAPLQPIDLADGEIYSWSGVSAGVSAAGQRVKLLPHRSARRRHTRKYAEGELPPDRSFYFRGPDEKLNLRAQNLIMFMQIGDGVDDETWLHHLRRRDYSKWFRGRIKDDALADDVLVIEEQKQLSAAESRALVRAAIEQRYTSPAGPPLPMPGTDAAPKGS